MQNPEPSPGVGEPETAPATGATTYRRVVVPLDGSELAEQALPHAEAIAHLTGAPLHLVRVIDPTHLIPLAGLALHPHASALELLLEDERIAAREYLQRIEQALLDRQQTVTVEYRLGPAAREILATAHSGDLLVMATHGLSGPARWFLGSVAEAAVRHSPVPGLLVRVSATAPAPPTIRRLVVPLDGSALAEEALPTAQVLAKRLHVPVHLLTVIDVSGAVPLELVAAAVSASRLEETLIQLFADAESHLARACERLRHTGVETSTEVRHGSPGRAIVAAAQPGDLIVMTSHGRSGFPRWFLGSVAEAVLRQSWVPVLLVRAHADGTTTSEATTTTRNEA
jgi:nucleotide-binding universal stress UspA family protein